MKFLVKSWVLVGVFFFQSADAAQILSIDFKVESSQSVIELTSDDAVAFTQEINSQDKQVILNMSGATLSSSALTENHVG